MAQVMYAVRKPQTNHADTAIDQPFEYRGLAAGRTDRAHSFGFSHEGGITGEQDIISCISWNTQAAPRINILHAHSSKRVPLPQSISTIRLILAGLTCMKTACYGLSFTSNDRARISISMDRQRIFGILVLWTLLTSFLLGLPGYGPSAFWLAERTEASEPTALSTAIDRAPTAPHIRHEQAAPQKALDLLARLQARNGNPLPGYVGGRTFQNRERLLPPGHYREYDVNQKIRGRSRGSERIVIEQDTGRAYYTGNHYRTFIPLNSE
jgi:guanyl-specific ribonuclease Sa